MHVFDHPPFEYLPGESVILPAHETMVIDFPEADQQNPTQCIALALDSQYIQESLQYLNEQYHKAWDERHDWKLQFNRYHFTNETEITDIINRLIRICSSADLAKNIYADLNLKELLIRLLQSQHMMQVEAEAEHGDNASRLHYVLQYIHEHLTEKILVDLLSRKAYLSRNMFFRWFKEQCGLSPLEYINKERIKLAKQLLADQRSSITCVSQKCGFTDVNYFVRLFKKSEGITPGAYQACAQHMKQSIFIE